MVGTGGGVEILDSNVIESRPEPPKVEEEKEDHSNDVTVNVDTSSSDVIASGEKLELSLPSNISYDETKAPEAGSFSYVDKNGNVVEQKKEDFENVKVKFDGDKVKVEGLVPGKEYEKLELKYIDKDGKEQNLVLKNVKIEPENESEKYLSNIYTTMFNRPADEKGYHYHLDNLKNKEVSLRDFLMDTLTQKEFIETHNTSESKIEALYGSILGREADEEGKGFWKGELNKILSEGKTESEAIKELADRMVNENELKELADKMDVEW